MWEKWWSSASAHQVKADLEEAKPEGMEDSGWGLVSAAAGVELYPTPWDSYTGAEEEEAAARGCSSAVSRRRGEFGTSSGSELPDGVGRFGFAAVAGGRGWDLVFLVRGQVWGSDSGS